MLKKLTLLLLLCGALNLHAQNDILKSISEIDFGVKFGISGAYLSSSDDNFNLRPSFLIGLTASYDFKNSITFHTGLLYLRYGESERENLPETGLEENTLKLDYLQIPLLVSYPVLENLRLEAGPGLSFLVHSKQEIIGQNATSLTEIPNDFNTFDVNFNLGLSYPTSWGLVIGLRYSRGFIDVDTDDAVFDKSHYNSAMQMSIEYRF